MDNLKTEPSNHYESFTVEPHNISKFKYLNLTPNFDKKQSIESAYDISSERNGSLLDMPARKRNIKIL